MNNLNNFAVGDTDYVTKLNANNAMLQASVGALEQLMAAQVAAGLNPGATYTALFGTTVAVIGDTSYRATGASTTLTVQTGYCWKPSISAVVQLPSQATISFAGQGAATYYLQVDQAGVPSRSTTSAEAVYSIVWTGTAFGAITRLAAVVWGAADMIAAQANAALGTSYTNLDTLLEAIATKAVNGDAVATWKSGRLSKSIAGGANVALTTTESNNFALEFTGTITANLDVTVTLNATGPRGWVVNNSTTGDYTVTLKAGGSGVKLPRGCRVWVMHDGTNLHAIQAAPARPAVTSTPYAASITADFSFADVVKVTLTGNPALTLVGAANGQRCILELTQDGTGGRLASFGAEVRFGADLTLITLSTDPGKTDKIGFIYDSAAGKYDAVAIMRGY